MSASHPLHKSRLNILTLVCDSCKRRPNHLLFVHHHLIQAPTTFTTVDMPSQLFGCLPVKLPKN
jgi:hypothetical protein